MSPNANRTGGHRALRILSRILLFAISLIFTCLLVFLALEALPGDAATQRLGLQATPERVAELTQQYGLDKPVLYRFVLWCAHALQGDFGTVLASGLPVADAMVGPLARTGVIFAISLVLVIVVGTAGGIFAGLHGGKAADKIVSTLALAVVGTPEFVVGFFLILVFATQLGWFPAVSLLPVGSGSMFDKPIIMVLPIVTPTVSTFSTVISLIGACTLVRPVRAVVERENQTLHVESARLSGLPERRVIVKNLLPGIIAPVAQSAASVVPYLIGGTVIIESLFSFPGLGTLLVNAVLNREPDLLMACSAVVIAVSLAAFWIADGLGRGRSREIEA